MKKIVFSLILSFILIWRISTAQIVQLWGMTSYGGTHNVGNIYSINADGSNFNNVFSFNINNGKDPENDLLQATDGKLYGVTPSGGTLELGNIFSINTVTDSFENLYVFSNVNAASYPQSNIIQASNGLIYGMTSVGGYHDLGIIFSFDINTNSLSTVYKFYSDSTGCDPGEQNIMQASNGKLYGLAGEGAYYNSSSGIDNGVIFSFDLSDSAYTDLYNFDHTLNDSDGNYPSGSLVEYVDGKLYGTCGGGGVSNEGTIFSFDPSNNTYKSLFDFSYSADGAGPDGSLVQLSNGRLYGVCSGGGYGDGTIFSYDPSDNSFERLYEFTGYSGENPNEIMLASDGKLYGTTTNGGLYGQGNIFSFDPDNNTFKDIFDFDTTEGIYVLSGVIEYNPNAGVNKVAVNNNQLSIYPNPSSGAINIVSSKNMDEVTVTNLLGQTVLKSPLGDLGVKQFTFNLKDAGMYFVTVTSENETQTKQIVVVK